MSKSTGFAARGALGAMLCLAFSAAPLPAGAAPGEESPRLPFTQRYQAVQHGGVVRTANSAITCRSPTSPSAGSCSAVRAGGKGANDDWDMFYVDEDDDPNTYNSSRAVLDLPANSRVTYARLYWGGNLRVGEQKPPKDNGRILIAEPGGRYKAVLADTRVAHRDTAGSDVYQASADVTRWYARAAPASTPWPRSMWPWGTPRPAPGAAGRWSSRTRTVRAPAADLALGRFRDAGCPARDP